MFLKNTEKYDCLNSWNLPMAICALQFSAKDLHTAWNISVFDTISDAFVKWDAELLLLAKLDAY